MATIQLRINIDKLRRNTNALAQDAGFAAGGSPLCSASLEAIATLIEILEQNGTPISRQAKAAFAYAKQIDDEYGG